MFYYVKILDKKAWKSIFYISVVMEVQISIIYEGMGDVSILLFFYEEMLHAKKA